MVRITDVETIVLRLDEVDATRADGTQDAFLVRIHTDGGLVGIGEADTAPLVARTIVEMPSSHSIARGLRELLVGEDPGRIDDLHRAMLRGSDHYGRGGAALHTISAIDMALWDLAGKVAGVPIASLLGARDPEAVDVYASALMPFSAEEAHALGRRAVAAGYRALKLGWGPLGQDVGRDAELVAAARAGLGADASLMLDGGRAYTVEAALELLDRVGDARLTWFEEPFEPDDLDSYRRLCDATPVPIAAGEAESGTAPFLALAEAGLSVLQPDLARCGGFSVAQHLLELQGGIRVVPHCFSTGVLVAASLQFVAAQSRPWFSEYSVADSPLVNGILTQPFVLEDGALSVPSGPGLGVELDDDAVARWRVD